MAWEKRGNQTYYYTAKRMNGRVVKTYVGSASGFVGLLCAEMRRAGELSLRALRQQKRLLLQEVQERQRSREAALIRCVIVPCACRRFWSRRQGITGTTGEDGGNSEWGEHWSRYDDNNR